jgi:hypothetical protein
MKDQGLFAIAVFFSLAVTPAHADIFKCVDSNGHITYSNIADKNCKKLSLDPLPSSSTPSTAKASVKTPTPSNFPKVDDNSQKSRDTDRRRILDGELETEQKNLEQAKAALAEQQAVRNGDEKNYQRVEDRLQPFKDKVALHERNIDAIQKELYKLR